MQVRLKFETGFPRSGATLVVIAALLFACKGTVIKYLYALGASVDDVMLLRMLFSLPAYAGVALVCIRREYRHLRASQLAGVAAIGIAGYYVASYLDLLGLQTISAGLERVILYTYPVFVLLLAAVVFRRSVSLAMLLWIAVTYVGLLIVFFADIRLQPVGLAATGRGALYVLLSAMAFAIYVVGSEHYLRSLSSALFTALAMMAAGLVMMLHYSISSSVSHLLQLSLPVYGWCALTALLFTVLPSFMMSAGVRQIGSARAGALGMVGPVATVLVAGAVLDEPVSGLQLAGLATVMLGVQRLHRS